MRYLQADHVCKLLKSQLYGVHLEVDNSIIDIMMVDYGELIGGLYSPLWLYNGGIENMFIGKCIVNLNQYFFLLSTIIKYADVES